MKKVEEDLVFLKLTLLVKILNTAGGQVKCLGPVVEGVIKQGYLSPVPQFPVL